MTSISQRDHDELMAAFDKQRLEASVSTEATRKFLVKVGFGNYCINSGGEVNGGDEVIPCDCEFCDSERIRQYYLALQHSRLFSYARH
jgi:hypothetical protein